MKVFYRPEQVATNTTTYSPSAYKPKQVVDDWLGRGIIQADDILRFEPVDRADFKRVHNPQMVDDVLDLKRRNGFRNQDPEVAASLPYTSGSLLAAARWALAHQEAVCSPTSGFHHAGFDEPEGYCTFNGLMVTAVKLIDLELVQRVSILDCDVHYGNGTDDIIARLDLDDRVIHHSMGKQFEGNQSVGQYAKNFMGWLALALKQSVDADLVIYQAGADPHIHDPMGGLLTTHEMLRRDLAVFRAFQGRPLVWNLAGGYQRDAAGSIEPVLQLHRNTAVACIRVARKGNFR
jgi:acetoin utilization deacetylase AcuC-like enzyme